METDIVVWIKGYKNVPETDEGMSALVGFTNNGAIVKIFEDIQEVPLKRNVLVVGSIEDTRYWFNEMGFVVEEDKTIPEELDGFAGRKIQRMTFGEAMKITQYPYFIKPYSKLKEFYPLVIRKDEDKKLFGDEEVPQNSIVLISEVVNFISEYRAYIVEGEVVGLKHYSGSYYLVPEQSVVEATIKAYRGCPTAYALDFGITDDGRTLLVEANDFWSLGCYSLYSKLYVRGLSKRWREILSQNPV